MTFRFSRHAEEELTRRQVPRQVVQDVLDHPRQIVPEREGRRAYQSVVDFQGKMYLVRAIVDDRVDPALVLTVYRTSKIDKYWR
jgi:hypothetical protein